MSGSPTNRVSQRREIVSLRGWRHWPGVAALVVMRKPGHGYFCLALALMLVAVLVFLPSGAGPGALDRGMAFTGDFTTVSTTWTWPKQSGQRKNTSQRETFR